MNVLKHQSGSCVGLYRGIESSQI